MTLHTTHVADGYIFKSIYTADADAPIQTLTGHSIVLFAAMATGASVAGVATIIGANEWRGVFATQSLPEGDWVVQGRLIAAGQPPKTILDFTLTVLESV